MAKEFLGLLVFLICAKYMYNVSQLLSTFYLQMIPMCFTIGKYVRQLIAIVNNELSKMNVE